MISGLFSWYQNRNVQQLQEPFNDQYKAAGSDEDWVEVITPVQKEQQQHVTMQSPDGGQQVGQNLREQPSDKTPVNKTSTIKTTESHSELAMLQKNDGYDAQSCSVETTDKVDSLPIKKLSRQERRAKARLATKEMKKQARIAALAAHYNKGMKGSGCLPTGPLTTN